MNSQAISLHELNGLIKGILHESLPEMVWIKAETSDVRVNQNGHCYLEFIEKDQSGRSIVAKARAMIWSNTFYLLRAYFESATKQPFASALKVLVQVSVEFHELYGFNLTVHDIDPAYTLGDQALNRAAILRQLEDEGVLTLNKELEIPLAANRIAIISSPTAAGYEDFCNQLYNNGFGFVFYTKLFPSIMQGDRAEGSIIAALEKIYDYQDLFDVVVIIRGGGATSELSCFDSYLLAASCAQFPLPIITGIGHERDETVLDIVANTRAKTPTAAAEFLVGNVHDAAAGLDMLGNDITETVRQILQDQTLLLNTFETQTTYTLKGWSKEQAMQLSAIKSHLMRNIQLLAKDNNAILINFGNSLKRESEQLFKDGNNILANISDRLKVQIGQKLKNDISNIENIEKHISLLSPDNILKKGYSLTMKNGNVVKTAKELQNGDQITTLLAEGSIKSIVKK